MVCLFCPAGSILLQGLDLFPVLIHTVEKAAAQSTQVPLVTEGVAAALLLCRLSVVDVQTGKLSKEDKVPGGWRWPSVIYFNRVNFLFSGNGSLLEMWMLTF